MYKTLTVFISVFLIDIFCRRNCLRMFSLKPLHWAVSLSSALFCASGNHAPAANTKIRVIGQNELVFNPKDRSDTN